MDRKRQKELINKLLGTQNPKILFICSGNIMRSPYAEMLFEKIWTEKHSSSRLRVASGATTYRNSSLSDLTETKLISEGVSLQRMRSFFPRHIDDYPELVKEATVVLVMTKDHLKGSLNKKDNALLLTDFVNGKDSEEISDPYFDSDPHLAYVMLKRYLIKLVDLLESNGMV